MGVVGNPRYCGRPTVKLDKEFNLLKKYDSITVCSIDNQVSKDRVRLTCTGSKIYLGDYIYMYEEEYNDKAMLKQRMEMTALEERKRNLLKNTTYGIYDIFDIENPEITTSFDIVALRTSVSTARVRMAIKNRSLINKKYFILINDDINLDTAKETKTMVLKNNRKLSYYIKYKDKK